MRSFGCVYMGGGLRVGGSDGRKCRNLLKKNIIHRRKKHVLCLHTPYVVRRSPRGAFLGGLVGRARIGRSMDHYLKFRNGGWSEGKVSSAAAAKGRRTLSSNAIGRAGGPFSREYQRKALSNFKGARGYFRSDMNYPAFLHTACIIFYLILRRFLRCGFPAFLLFFFPDTQYAVVHPSARLSEGGRGSFVSRARAPLLSH